MKKRVLSILFVFFAILLLAGCKKKVYSVTFDAGGGSPTPVVQEIKKDKSATKPDDPTREGYRFLMWQLDGEKYEFTEKVVKNITLVAKWEKEKEDDDDDDPIVGTAEIKGVLSRRTITVGDEFDPFDGVTAIDKYGEDITADLETDFEEKWLTNKGNYRYYIWVYDEGQRVRVSVILVVESAESDDIVITAPEAVTYYIESGEFNPILEVSAYDVKEDEVVEVFVEDFDDYYVNSPGTYNYEVIAYDAKGREAKTTIKLTTKAAVNIPNTLPSSKISIEMWHSNGSAIEDALKKYAKDFEAMMLSKGYQVEVLVEKPASTYDDLRTTVVNALKGATLPQLVQNYPDHVVEYNSHKAISSLMPYINHPVWGMNPDVESEAFIDILEGYRKEQRAVGLDGDYLSLPFNKSTEVVAYNKDMFDFVLQDKPFPETWQELFALGPELIANKDRFIDAIVANWEAAGSPLDEEEITIIKENFVPFAYDSKANAFITLSRQFGGQYTGRNPDGSGRLLFDSSSVKSMLEYFGGNNDLFVIPERWETNYASDMIKKGYTAMAIGSTGGIRYNTPYEKGTKLFNLGVAPMFYDADHPNRKAVIQQGTNISLTNEGTPEQKLVAWLFLKYLTSNEVQEDFAILTGYSPVRNSVYSNDGFLAYLANADNEIKANASVQGLSQAKYQEAFELKVKAMAFQAVKDDRQHLFYDTPFIGSSATRTAVGVAFERVILRPEGTSLSDAINNAIQYALDEAGRIVD
ncbi:MAG TPA: extracellular solute-binding protein [Acholeplasmataceae bacterium]|nr:extracellular solute-binding protein [Acholeplasmataceae bacterium]